MVVQTPELRQKRERLNAICPYFTMFPLSVPVKQLTGLDPNAWILDPFCGRGSTNFAARLVGLNSVGVDSNPVATAIAEGKMVEVSAEAVSNLCKELLCASTSRYVEVPVGDFWSLCFHPNTLNQLCIVRSMLISNCESPDRKALRALILGLLHGPRNKGIPSYLSNQMPRTYAAKPDYAVRFWKNNNLTPVDIDLCELVGRKADYYFATPQPTVDARILCADSRTVDLAGIGPRFSRVVTSPPYYGMRTYIPDQWLRNWFIGGPAITTYSQPKQLSHGSAIDFSEQLSGVWTNVAKACVPGAKWMIRFGGIHDRKDHPKDILLSSLEGARCKLRLLTVRSAGSSLAGKRQADQFNKTLRTPIEELDFYVRTEEPL